MTARQSGPQAARPDGRRWRWPAQLFNGRVRTSTVLLIIAFVLVWWVYDTYRTQPTPPAAPQVVPPGFIPDPAYTWVPRTRVQQPTTTVETPAPTTETTTPTEPPGEPPTPTPVPGFPFCPPLCPPPAPTPPEQPAHSPPPGSPPAPVAPGVPPPPASPGPATSQPAVP